MVRYHDDLWWVASDAKGPTGNVLLHVKPHDGTRAAPLAPPKFRRQHSAESAILMWSTPWRCDFRMAEPVVLGTPDDDGHLRGCPASRFFDGIEGVIAQGRGIPLLPTSRWLSSLCLPNGGSVWDLVEDRNLLQLVPLSGRPRDLIEPALRYLLQEVIRRPPYHPDIPPYRYPGTRDPYCWPRIEALEWGCGACPAGTAPVLRPGRELIVRVSGGIEWCPAAGCQHSSSGFTRLTWFVLSLKGIIPCCAHKECRPRGSSEYSHCRAPAIQLPPAVAFGLRQWLVAARAAELPPSRREREPSPEWFPAPLEEYGWYVPGSTPSPGQGPRKVRKTLRRGPYFHSG